jgi:antitoxin component of RelBE/YafQ-DinJ toxin-antitoxin module
MNSNDGRINIRLDPDLAQKAKDMASERGVTLSALIRNLLSREMRLYEEAKTWMTDVEQI